MKAKICGITNLNDALNAAKSGAWALGFNFCKGSDRYISIAKAKEICAKLPQKIIKVGIFINYSPVDIIMARKFLDYFQLYKIDNNLPISKAKVILSLPVASAKELPEPKVIQEYGHILIDAPINSDGLLGGTGRTCNWDLAKDLAKKYKVILAGGLNINNINQGINCVQPFAVDVASSLELSPGIKNSTKVTEFLKRCKNEY